MEQNISTNMNDVCDMCDIRLITSFVSGTKKTCIVQKLYKNNTQLLIYYARIISTK